MIDAEYVEAKRKRFPEMESTPVKDTVKIVEMTTKNLDKDLNFKSSVDKMLSNGIARQRIFHESQFIWQISLLT